MRICPHCEYVDPAYWKHVKYSYWIDSCSFENFNLLKPDLAKRLSKKPGSTVDDKLYIYRVTMDGYWVERKAKIDFVGGGGFRDGTERVPHSPWNNDNSRSLWGNYSIKQTKLVTDHE